jgi:hypothetical protein
MAQWAAAKEEEYIAKATNAATNALSLITASFPYGVGPAIIAAKLAAAQALATAADAAEGIATAAAIANKLSQLDIKECP